MYIENSVFQLRYMKITGMYVFILKVGVLYFSVFQILQTWPPLWILQKQQNGTQSNDVGQIFSIPLAKGWAPADMHAFIQMMRFSPMHV